MGLPKGILMKRFICALGLMAILAVGEVSLAKAHRKITFPLPGSASSGTNPTLQKDALVTVLAVGTSTVGPECKPKSWDDMYITDTNNLSFPKLLGYKNNRQVIKPWKELWTVNACGKIVDVTIMFMPDPDRTGTAFKVDMPQRESESSPKK